MRVWADANRPVVEIEAASKNRLAMTVRFESLRPVPAQGIQANTVVPDEKNRIAWYYRNQNWHIPQLDQFDLRGNGPR